jgi:hypothetical protein
VIKKALPRAEPSEGERRALDVCESAWLRREHGRRNNRILRRDAVAVEGCECEDLVTRSDVAYTRSNFRNDARQLVRRDRRQMLCGPGQLVACKRRRIDTHERLPLERARHWELLDR